MNLANGSSSHSLAISTQTPALCHPPFRVSAFAFRLFPAGCGRKKVERSQLVRIEKVDEKSSEAQAHNVGSLSTNQKNDTMDDQRTQNKVEESQLMKMDEADEKRTQAQEKNVDTMEEVSSGFHDKNKEEESQLIEKEVADEKRREKHAHNVDVIEEDSSSFHDKTKQLIQLIMAAHKSVDAVGNTRKRKRDEKDPFTIIALKKGQHNFLVGVEEVSMDLIEGLDGDEESIARRKVTETLLAYRSVHDKLLRKAPSGANLSAYQIFRRRTRGGNRIQKVMGSVLGVKIGDEFHLRAEMSLIGLHSQLQAGIDYMKQYGIDVAISIVSSGRYNNCRSNSDVLIYSGSGVTNEDQELKRGNLALKNCIEARTPVRVIHGVKNHYSRGVKYAKLYIYDGVYLVEKHWVKKNEEGHCVLMFRLRRIPGQPQITIGSIQNSRNQISTSSALSIEGDLSHGEEDLPIRIVNSIDGEVPDPFNYTTKLIHPPSYIATMPKGCDCTDGCSDSRRCSCALKNGGKLPFNYGGAIMIAKPVVYECGPSCQCPPSCRNRVSQHGIKFQLEVYKTKTRGWGVRSPYFIPSGSFVCEYTGEILEDEEAQKRVSDQYLFAIGNNFHDEPKGKRLPSLQDEGVVMEGSYAVDASKYGNVGRFINHSCTPNLYAQNLFYDHEDMRMPHVMFFASEDIQPFQELTYDYNYVIDQVYDSNGNIKKKECLCGSSECTGWLY